MKTIFLSFAMIVVADLSSYSPWKIVITDKNEPGELLIVSGRVFAPDGKDPVVGIRVYVYHTDATGDYNPGKTSSKNPRLHGTMVTNEEGRYEFRTIKPASYRGSQIPAHVHYVISDKDHPEQYAELEFDGDPFLSKERIENSKALGTFGGVQKLKKDADNVWRCVKDIRLNK